MKLFEDRVDLNDIMRLKGQVFVVVHNISLIYVSGGGCLFLTEGLGLLEILFVVVSGNLLCVIAKQVVLCLELNTDSTADISHEGGLVEGGSETAKFLLFRELVVESSLSDFADLSV